MPRPHVVFNAPGAFNPLDRFATLLDPLPTGTSVAVVMLRGSLCPVTIAHVQGFIEARRLLLGEEGMSRPAKLEPFKAVLGFISLNSDEHVSKKLAEKRQASMSYSKRLELVKLAVAEHMWMGVDLGASSMLSTLQARWPRLSFVKLTMNGADDVLKYRKWTQACPEYRLLTLGRRGDTEAVIKAAASAGIDLDAGNFIMGPVRRATRRARMELELHCPTIPMHARMELELHCPTIPIVCWPPDDVVEPSANVHVL